MPDPNPSEISKLESRERLNSSFSLKAETTGISDTEKCLGV